MRLKIEDTRETRTALHKWHKWFAWYPVKVREGFWNDHCWCLFENVLRRGTLHDQGTDSWWTWQYYVNEPRIALHLAGRCGNKEPLHTLEECR